MIYRDFFTGIKLPNVLTDSEFRYYYNLFKNGDMNAREILINHNIKLVLLIVSRDFCETSYDMEDLASVGIFGLMKAIDSYDINKNDKFSNYASKCIHNEILMYIRRNKKNEEASVEEIYFEIEDEVVSIFDFIIDDTIDLEEYIINMNFRLNLMKFLDNILKENEKKVVYLYFGFINGIKYKQEEISVMLGMCRPNVSKVLNRALKKIKNNILLVIENVNELSEYLDNKGTIKCYNTKKLIK